MTESFRTIKVIMDNEEKAGNYRKENDKEWGRFICLYQIADSLNEIDKDLKNIVTELKKRKV